MAFGRLRTSIGKARPAHASAERDGDTLRVMVDQVRGALASDIARGGNVLAGAMEGAYGLRPVTGAAIRLLGATSGK